VQAIIETVAILSLLGGMVGWGWVVYRAFESEAWKGFLCLAAPFLNLFYAIRHFNDVPEKSTKIALLLEVQSLMFVMVFPNVW